jgi:hypothetical protein
MMAQQRVTDVAIPSGVAAEDTANMSGQAGGGGGTSVSGDLGGGQQHGTGLPYMPDGPRNTYGHPTGNPSGDGVAPALDSVFGDLGGSGTSRETSGTEIPAAPYGTDPGGQGGR